MTRVGSGVDAGGWHNGWLAKQFASHSFTRLMHSSLNESDKTIQLGPIFVYMDGFSVFY
jgi:hypothetical protein